MKHARDAGAIGNAAAWFAFCAWGGMEATNRVQHDALCVLVPAEAFILCCSGAGESSCEARPLMLCIFSL